MNIISKKSSLKRNVVKFLFQILFFENTLSEGSFEIPGFTISSFVSANNARS